MDERKSERDFFSRTRYTRIKIGITIAKNKWKLKYEEFVGKIFTFYLRSEWRRRKTLIDGIFVLFREKELKESLEGGGEEEEEERGEIPATSPEEL